MQSIPENMRQHPKPTPQTFGAIAKQIYIHALAWQSKTIKRSPGDSYLRHCCPIQTVDQHSHTVNSTNKHETVAKKELQKRLGSFFNTIYHKSDIDCVKTICLAALMPTVKCDTVVVLNLLFCFILNENNVTSNKLPLTRLLLQ